MRAFLDETELPGKLVSLETWQIISHRYYWASRFVSGRAVLDIGCGPGLGLGYLRSRARWVVGGDITWDNLALARTHYGSSMSLVCLDAHRLPFQRACLDVVVCLAAVIYMDLPVLLDECQRILRPDGVLILNTPNKQVPGFRPSLLSRCYYSAPELCALLSQHGFEANLFGAFPLPRGTAGIRYRLATVGARYGSGLLKSLGLYQSAKRLLGIQPASIALPAELVDMEPVKDLRVDPIPGDADDSEHRIIYAVARPR